MLGNECAHVCVCVRVSEFTRGLNWKRDSKARGLISVYTPLLTISLFPQHVSTRYCVNRSEVFVFIICHRWVMIYRARGGEKRAAGVNVNATGRNSVVLQKLMTI